MRGRLEGRRLVYILGITNLLLLVIVGYLVFFNDSTLGSSETEEQQKYPYLSKRIFTENQNDTIINFVPLRQELREYLDSADDEIGVYFEYLPSGTSVGINDREPFFGASLLKLPVAMKAYKLIEQGVLDEDQELTISPEHLDKGFGDLWKKGAGYKLSLKEAIRLSISQSDNTADKLLRDLVEPRPVSDVFDYLDIETNVAEGPGAGVTPKNFSSVLRALYLSAYLERQSSNKLLDTMTVSPYKDRIAAGIPESVKIAHKVGIYKQPDDPNVQVHSDCGIVYAQLRPYILCVMTKASIDDATTQIADISKLVYDYVANAN